MEELITKTKKPFYTLIYPMEYKLNSLKTFKDNGILVVCGMIIALFGMLLPMTRGATYNEEEKSEEEPTIESENVEESGEWYPGELNSEGNAQEMPVLTATESHQRFIELCERYNLPADVIWNTENYYGLKEGTILCIAIAETSGGTRGYGKDGCWNYGNVGNTDNPNNRRCFANQGAGLAAIGQTLNNDYLKNNQTIACLNGAGECIEPKASNKRYSTGKSGNRQRNMISCFYDIYQTPINPQTFNLHDR